MRLRMFTLVSAMLVAVTSHAAPPPGIPDGWSDGYFFANGARLHYYHAVPAAGKPVIVMVHGVTDIGLSWTTLTWELEDNYDIYMLDGRGHGLSDPFSDADDGDTMVQDVVDFVEDMGFDKPILMGHSLGAATVMRIGAEYPELAQAVIMLDPGLPNAGRGAGPGAGRGAGRGADGRGGQNAPPTPQPEESSAPANLSINMFGTPEMLVAQNNYEFDDLVPACSRNTPKWDLVDCQYWALSKIQYHGPYTDAQREALSGPMGTGNALAGIPVPVLVLKADASPEVRESNLERAGVIQNGRLVHIDGAGHNLHHDELERTVEVMTEFLSDP